MSTAPTLSPVVPLRGGATFDLSALPTDSVVALDVSYGTLCHPGVPLQSIFDGCVSLGLDVVTFTHELSVFRHQQVADDGSLLGGGGTDFRPVVLYVEANRIHASRVVVVTDGMAREVSPALPERWTWLLSSDGVDWMSEHSPDMQVLRLA